MRQRSRLGIDVTPALPRLVRKGPRESQRRDDGSDGPLIQKCYDISGVNTSEELLELLARIREFKDGQLQEVEVLKDVEKAKALLTENKRKLSDIRHGVSSRKCALHEPSYLDLKEKTPKPGKRERKERRTKKFLKMIGSAKQLYYDSPNHVASGSNR